MTDLFGLRPSAPPGSGTWRAPVFKDSTAADATGAATLSLPAVPAGQVWVLERINIAADTSASPTLTMFDGGDTSTATFLDGSSTGANDVDDGAVLTLFTGDRLTFVWAGCNPGDVCSVRVQYRVEQASAQS